MPIINRVRTCAIALLLVLSSTVSATAAADTSADVVLVAGATGRLGKHVIQELAAQGFAVRGLTRDAATAREKYGDAYEWVTGDVRDATILPAAIAGARFVVLAAGSTTPSGPNGPKFVDYDGARHTIDAAVAAGVEHFVFVSSIGVTQRFHLLNTTFGNVLSYKWQAEQYLRASGLRYTIVRPGGLRPGRGGIEGLSVMQGDPKGGSYVLLPDLARLIAAAVNNADAYGKSFEVLSARTQGPDNWVNVFADLAVDSAALVDAAGASE
jgi:uncharacterized protein YbjT (DUF2867 family)